MKITLKLSRVGMNMQEATIAKWHKQVGDTFAKDEALYEIETEKVTQEVLAPGRARCWRSWFPRVRTPRRMPGCAWWT